MKNREPWRGPPVAHDNKEYVKMLRSLDELVGYPVHEADGRMGVVRDFLINRDSWQITYLEIDLTDWYPGKKVIVPPTRIKIPEGPLKHVPVSLTKKEVLSSPALALDEEVCRKHEEELALHFGWSPCFINPDNKQVNLKSLRDMVDYHIHALDGSLGHIEDFIIDDQAWVVRYVVVRTSNWLPGKRVLMAPEWISSVIWEENNVVVGQSREEIKNGPKFDPGTVIQRSYETELYRHFDQPTYWD
jgi:hypothetical protein